MKTNIHIDNETLGKIHIKNIMIRKVSGNIFRSIIFYILLKLRVNKENYDKNIDSILIIKNNKDV